MDDEIKIYSIENILNTLVVECNSIYLHQKDIDLKIEVPKEKIERFEYLVINGITFKKDKSE